MAGAGDSEERHRAARPPSVGQESRRPQAAQGEGEGGHAGPGHQGPAGPTKLVRPCQPCPPPGRAEDGSPRQRGCRRLNHLSLCSPQLNGSGQLKMSSHCLSAQMLAPPPPGLPRLALPPVTKPTSEGGSTSPTSPCKHSGKRCPWPGGRPRGPPTPLPNCWDLAGAGEFGVSTDRPGAATGPGTHGFRAAFGSSRGRSAICPLGHGAQSRRVSTLGPKPPSHTGAVGTAGEGLHWGQRPDLGCPVWQLLESRHFT